MEFLIVLAVGLVAGTLGGIVGFGASIMLMPVLVIAFGPLQAVPVMAIAALLANLSRIVVWWREIDWKAGAAYAVTGVPAAALGVRTLASLPPRVIEIAIGIFFIGMVLVRRWMAARDLKFGPWQLAALGLVIGYVTGIVVSTGPITAPIFLGAGLVRGAFIGTEAAASLAVYLGKAATFRALDMLPADIVARGLITGASLMVGAFVARRFVLEMAPAQFRRLMDGLMLASGAVLLWSALVGAR
ncbi:MAG TPA: sulfite exporter TauE/SafE family protein [Burkholderiales bacterium]|nr:sulfite exporter TauE/SafE family protein [Burkholderiales bacterium]